MSAPRNPWLRGGGGAQNDFIGGAPEPVVGEVIALRQFVLQDGVLYGIVHPQPALDGINVAVCASRRGREQPHPQSVTVPVSGHSCGFYSYDWPKSWMRSASRVGSTATTVTAVVALSGRVVVCRRGLKAQKMRVVGVALPSASAEVRAEVSRNYPSADIADSTADLIARHPLTPMSRFALGDAERRAKGQRPSLSGQIRARMSPSDVVSTAIVVAGTSLLLNQNPLTLLALIMFVKAVLGAYQVRDLPWLAGWGALLVASTAGRWTVGDVNVLGIVVGGAVVAVLYIRLHAQRRRRAVAVVEGPGVLPSNVQRRDPNDTDGGLTAT